MTRSPLTQAAIKYFDTFRTDSHKLLHDGYLRSRSRITSSLKEDAITGIIAEEIDSILKSRTTPLKIRKHYSIEEQPPLRDPQGKKSGNNRSRADIRVRSVGRLPPSRYLFEAKRLRRPGHLSKKYLGPGGLHQLLNDKSYINGAIECAMVGYMQSDTTAFWISNLNSTLASMSAQITTQSNLGTPTAACGAPNTMVSVHDNVDGENMAIYHIFMDCT